MEGPQTHCQGPDALGGWDGSGMAAQIQIRAHDEKLVDTMLRGVGIPTGYLWDTHMNTGSHDTMLTMLSVLYCSPVGILFTTTLI